MAVSRLRLVLAAVLASSFVTAPLALPTEPSFAERNDEDSDGISVVLEGDGTITQLSGGKDETLSPVTDAPGLPFRVVVTYSREGQVSSNPDLIAGADGPVRMDVAVYNTTGKMQTISADVDGRSVSAERLVSTPLTVTASATLPEVNPSQVITTTNRRNQTGPTSNGVVGVDADGRTVVQWAGVTGISPLGSVTRFSLVVDATDFTPPSINLGVSPGFGLHQVSPEGESALVVSTLETLTDVSDVLDESGEALAQAHARLTEAGAQIGEQTISDLQTSSRRIEANAKATAATLEQVASQANSAYEATGSLVAGQLSETSTVVRQLLGDPAASVPDISIDSDTCEITDDSASGSDSGSDSSENDTESVAKTRLEEGSVLGVIRGLSARLTALSQTSSRCEQVVIADLDRLLGPSEPDQDNCEDDASALTCLLHSQRAALDSSIEAILDQDLSLLAKLRQGPNGPTLDAVDQLDQSIQAMAVAKVFTQPDPFAPIGKLLAELDALLTNTESLISGVYEEIEAIHSTAANALSTSASQKDQITQLKREICFASGKTIRADGLPTAPTIGPAEATRLLRMLSITNCPVKEPEPGQPFEGMYTYAVSPNSVEALGIRMDSDLQKIAAASNGSGDPSAASNATLVNVMKKLTESIASLRTHVDKMTAANEISIAQASQHREELLQLFAAVQSHFDVVKQRAEELSEHLGAVGDEMEQFVNDTKISSAAQTQDVLDNSLLGINAARDQNAEAAQRVFGTFTTDLQDQSARLIAVGVTAAADATNRVTLANDQFSAQTLALMRENSAHVQHVTGGAVSDSQAVSALLSSDIAKVLQDIGTNANDGAGLLGAISSTSGYLDIADGKMADANTHTQIAQSAQRTVYGHSLFDSATLRASLARLEQPFELKGQNAAIPARWISVRIDGGIDE